MTTAGKSKRGGKHPESAVKKNCETCERWKEVRKQVRIAELLETAIKKLKTRFTTDDFKPSIADYLKLVEIEEELEQRSDAVKEIKVTWVESKESDTDK